MWGLVSSRELCRLLAKGWIVIRASIPGWILLSALLTWLMDLILITLSIGTTRMELWRMPRGCIRFTLKKCYIMFNISTIIMCMVILIIYLDMGQHLVRWRLRYLRRSIFRNIRICSTRLWRLSLRMVKE